MSKSKKLRCVGLIIIAVVVMVVGKFGYDTVVSPPGCYKVHLDKPVKPVDAVMAALGEIRSRNPDLSIEPNYDKDRQIDLLLVSYRGDLDIRRTAGWGGRVVAAARAAPP